MPSSTPLTKTLVQDTGTPQLLTDPEYDEIVLLEDNAYRAAAVAARAISAKYADQVDMGGGSSDLKLSQLASNYLKLSESYDKRASQGGDGGTGMAGISATGTPTITGISIEEIQATDSDPDRYDGAFSRGQMSNPPSINDPLTSCGGE